ncbi:MAG: hypothetical protein VKN33_10060 [Candidatus Sericytochromatia bacterium]|nr:hypothetical protein [Candidatus Sericytochromatia bacterium]
MPSEELQDFYAGLSALKTALEGAPRGQIELLEAVDRLYENLEQAGEALPDAALLEAQVTLRHAESILTRYFGM